MTRTSAMRIGSKLATPSPARLILSALTGAFALMLAGTASAQQPDSKADSKDDPNANCVCPPQDLKSRATVNYVFLGTIAERNDSPVFDGEKMEAKAEYTFSDVEWLKGKLPAPVKARTFVVSCSTTFEIGKRYLVFGNQNEHEQLTASHCSGNRIATPAIEAEIREIIAKLKPPKDSGNPLLRNKDKGSKGAGNKAGSNAGNNASNASNASNDADKKSGSSMTKFIALGIGVLSALLVVFLFTRRKNDE